MASLGNLYVFDRKGETLRRRDVRYWYVRDAGVDEDERGVYISLGPENDNAISGGVTLTEAGLGEIGFFRLDRLDETQLLKLGYVKVF